MTTDKELQLKQAWEKYRAMWHSIEIPAKTMLLKEGAISNRLYVIKKGSVRTWVNHDGKEISFRFFFEGDAVCSVESFRKQIPSAFAIETIEPSVLNWISKADIDTAVQEDAFLNHYLVDWAVDRQAEFIRHFLSLLMDNPQQRYANLLKEQPQIIRRVPLQYIASYLGIITPVSLSRIRNRA